MYKDHIKSTGRESYVSDINNLYFPRSYCSLYELLVALIMLAKDKLNIYIYFILFNIYCQIVTHAPVEKISEISETFLSLLITFMT